MPNLRRVNVERSVPVLVPTKSRPIERDYVLGTGVSEIERLGIQHEAWRPHAVACWRRAGFEEGQRVLDVGAGPGHAAIDLAELVGPFGSVTALERSHRFVEAGRATAAAHDHDNVHFHEVDLMRDPIPGGPYDAAWCRWVASFVESPEVLVRKIADSLRPGGTVAFHEYVDYASWRYAPPLPKMGSYVARVMESWRALGGEPDVATSVVGHLRANGFDIRSVHPHVFAVRPGHPMWRWIETFVASNLDRLTELGAWDRDSAQAAHAEFQVAAADPATVLITPMVMEIVAERR